VSPEPHSYGSLIQAGRCAKVEKALDHLLTVVSLDYTVRTLSATVRVEQGIVQPAADDSGQGDSA